MISVIDTGFEGLKIIETNHFQDERGFFHKFFSKDAFSTFGLDTDFKESYYSINKKNVIRGMHFQIPPVDHTKLVYVTSGKILDVVLDIRKNSATFGKYFSVELSADVAKAVYISKGFAHGFLSLEDNTCVHYMQTSCYDQERDCGIKYDSFGYDWGVKEPILSVRDLQHYGFNDFDSPFTGKKVVLTGSTGLIGKEAIEPLKRAGFEVYCLTSKNCNLFDYGAVSKFFEQIKPQYLLHFAWITGGDYLTNPINNDYVYASMNMLKEFKKNGGKRVVMAGTCFEYDFKDEPLKEDDKLNPKTLYAQCKVKLSELATDFCEKNNISFGWGRIFYVYGNNEKEGRLTQSIISKLKKNEIMIVNYGQLIRDYIYSRDVAIAFVKFLVSKENGVMNICTGVGVSLGDFAKSLAKKYGKEKLIKVLNKKSMQPLRIVGDNKKLVNLLGVYNFENCMNLDF